MCFGNNNGGLWIVLILLVLLCGCGGSNCGSDCGNGCGSDCCC